MIEVKNIAVWYDKNNIISDISLSFPENSFTCLIGPNGSGKSTLIKTMACMIPFFGEILYRGVPLKHMARRDRARLIAYLPQSRPVPDIDVGMMVEHGRFPHLDFMKKLSGQDKEAIDKAVELTGIAHLLDRRVSQLSGGERQRVYLAMAVAQDAEVILLDEPMTHLDINFQIEILKIVSELHKEGKTVIMAAHDLPQAFSFSQYICVINQGEVVCHGTPPEVCRQSAIKDVFGFGIKNLSADHHSVYAYTLVKEGLT